MAILTPSTHLPTAPQSERLIRLTIALFLGQTISVAYITQHYYVSTRTAHRDISALSFILESAGPSLWRLATNFKHS